MKSSFAVNVSSINGRTGQHVDDVSLSGFLEGLKTTGGQVNADCPIRFSGSITAIDGGLQADGEVASSWNGECRRCLGEAHGAVLVQTRELFEKEPTEGETYPISGDFLDLEAMIREAVMLELPVAPLCRPNCAGLCPVCGANKNSKDCGHTVEIVDDRWAALDALKDN